MSTIQVLNAVINGLSLGMLLAIPALALTLIYRMAKFPNMVVGDQLTLGAYAAVVIQAIHAVPIFVLGLASGLVGAIVSVICYFAVFRKLRDRIPLSSMIAAIGLAFILRNCLTLFLGHSQTSIDAPLVRSWNLSGVRVHPNDVWIMGISLVILALTFTVLQFTPIGRQLRAVASNPTLAQVSGIRAERLMIVVFAMFGFYCGIGGVMLGIKSVVTPEMGWDLILPILAAIILGGVGSPVGAVVGTVLFCISAELASALFGSTYKISLSFVVLMLVLLFMPQGICGRREAVK